MPINRYFAGSTWLVLALVAPSFAADPAGAVADVRVVPRLHQWTLVAPEQRAILTRVVGLPSADRDELLRSNDARLRGIGIFIAEQQGDLAALLSLAHLLADNAPTVAYAAPVAQPGEYHVREQTVAEYLTAVYLEWFGVDVDKAKERFDNLLAPMKNETQNLVQPWIVRLRRAQADEKEVAKIKAAVAELPEEVRWAVVTLGYGSSLYTKTEAGILLAKLSEKTHATVRNREKLLPNEPLFRSPSFRDAAVRQYEQLVKP